MSASTNSPTRRIACIALPRIRLELARAALSESTTSDMGVPLAIVIARPGGTVKDDTSLLGNTRLDEVSREAYALGVRRGDTIAAARARIAELRVRVVQAASVRAAMERMCEALLAFGATTSFDDGDNETGEAEIRTPKRDVLWIDVSGCAHLHDEADETRGEHVLASRIAACVHALGHACRVAIADGAYIAAAVAWYARIVDDKQDARTTKDARAIVVPHGKNAHALRTLSLRALPLTDDAKRWLTKSGLTCAGDLQKLPRRSLGVRLGAVTTRVMTLLEGIDATPLAPYVAPEIPEERAELEYGVESTEALVFVAKKLADGMAVRLAGRVKAATRFELILLLDRAFAPDRPREVYPLVLPAPIADASAMLNVLRARLESLVVSAPVLGMSLRATEISTRTGIDLDLFAQEAKAERALPRLVSELSAELGTDCVGVLTLTNRWLAEDRSALVPYTRALRSPLQTSLVTSSAEPSRVLASSIPLAPSEPPLEVRSLLIRVEAIEWWRHGLTSRDFVTAWREDARSLAWVEIDRASGSASIRGWME